MKEKPGSEKLEKEKLDSEKLELEKLELEKQRLQSEVGLKQSEIEIKRDELKAKLEGERKSVWLSSPLAVAGLSAIFGLLGTGVGASLQGYWNGQLERRKFETTLIQKALEPSDKKEAAKNLKFLVDAGLIQTLDAGKISTLAENPDNLPKFTPSMNVSFPKGTKLSDAMNIIAEAFSINISFSEGCNESFKNAEIEGGNIRANSVIELIEAIQLKLKDPDNKIRYRVKEVQENIRYEIICVNNQ